MSRILGLYVNNVKKIRAVALDKLDKNVVVVKGNNAQGKTSLIDSIQYVLGGTRTHPPRVIREGTTRAEVVLETDEYIVTRRWDAEKGTSLEVRTAKGDVPVGSPQKVLDGLVGRLSFDPLEFLNLEPKKQLEALKKLVGLDFTELEAKRLKAYTDRTAEKKALAAMEGQLALVDSVDEVQPVDLSELLAKVSKANDAMSYAREDARTRADHKAAIERADKRIADLDAAREREEVEYQEKMKALEKAHAARLDAIAKERAEVTTDRDERGIMLEVPPVDPAPIQAELDELQKQLKGFEATNVKARAWEQKKALVKRLEDQRKLISDLDETIRVCDVEKIEKIAATKFPVDGLGLNGEEGVLFKGVPLEQASGAERVRVSVAMGVALNPKLRVLLVRDASLLDENSMEALKAVAVEHDAQVWLEVVGNEGEGIIIEDGEVVAGPEVMP